MSLIERHGRCVGIKLLRFGAHQLELWYCPGGEQIRPHVHERCDVSMMILAGRMYGAIGHRHGPITWRDMLRVFRIPAGVVHSAYVVKPFCIFASWERWMGRVTSAADDFVETQS